MSRKSILNKSKSSPSFTERYSLIEIFKEQGNQSIVGLLQDNVLGTPVVFKISKCMDRIVRHEYKILKSLLKISPFCPHFVKPLKLLQRPCTFKVGNPDPFDVENCTEIHSKDVLIEEYINGSCKLHSFFKSKKKISDTVIVSTITQVLMAIHIAQTHTQAVHYDLHSNNILMKKCSKNAVFLYHLDKETSIAVPTNGYYPVIIDYGFGYSKSSDDDYLWITLSHTESGFMSDRFDRMADPKLFLVTVADEFIGHRKSSPAANLLKTVVDNIFGNLSIDMETGWDKGIEEGATDIVADTVGYICKQSPLFHKKTGVCIDLLLTLILLPMEKQNIEDLEISFDAFLTEFVKIEGQLENNYKKLMVLEALVDSARKWRADYADPDTTTSAVKAFEIEVYEAIDKHTKFCKLEGVKFEKMLCGLYCFTQAAEGIMCAHIETRMLGKEMEYSLMPLGTIPQMQNAISANIPDYYEYTPATEIFVFDSEHSISRKLTLSQSQCDAVNKIHPIYRGKALKKIEIEFNA